MSEQQPVMEPPKAPGIYARGEGIDPTVLERASELASASRMDLITRRQKEIEAQSVSKAKMTEYAEYARQMNTNKRQLERQEAAKTKDVQGAEEQKREQYAQQLAAQRTQDGQAFEKQLKAQEASIAENMAQRADEIRRKTAEYGAELRQKTELERVARESSGRTRQERENQFFRLEALKLRMGEQRDTVLESIRLGGTTAGAGLRAFLTDYERMTALVLMASGAALGIYGARSATGVAGRWVDARLGKPSLVRETSRKALGGALHYARHPVAGARELHARLTKDSAGRTEDVLSGVVLAPTLEQRLRSVAASTLHTKRNRAPFRHLLLHGPPGTGKTLFAKRLAQHSGMDYAVMTGGDIAPLGKDAVTEIHKLFEWAEASPRGVVLFVDEADAFLRRRVPLAAPPPAAAAAAAPATPAAAVAVLPGQLTPISEDSRNALNAFLYRTGSATDKFMLVYASNAPEQFDRAINDRIDELVPFALPGLDERQRLLALYMDEHLLNPPHGTATARVRKHHHR